MRWCAVICRLTVSVGLLATALVQIWFCVTALCVIAYPAVPIAIIATMAGVHAWLAWVVVKHAKEKPRAVGQ